jgi:hypothetical protein
MYLQYYDLRNNSANSKSAAVLKHGFAISLTSTLSCNNFWSQHNVCHDAFKSILIQRTKSHNSQLHYFARIIESLLRVSHKHRSYVTNHHFMVTTTDHIESLLTSHGFKQSVVLRVHPLLRFYAWITLYKCFLRWCVGVFRFFFFFFWLVVASVLFIPVFVLEP